MATKVEDNIVGDDGVTLYSIINVWKETLKIKQPQHKDWDKKNVGDTFVVHKNIIGAEEKGILTPKDTVTLVDGTDKLEVKSIFQLKGLQEVKPNIVMIVVLMKTPEHYIMYTNGKAYKVPNDFTMVRNPQVKIAAGTRFYVDVSNRLERTVQILSTVYHDAKAMYLDKHGKDSAGIETFMYPPVVDDEYINYHRTSNIAIQNIKFSGMFMLEPLEFFVLAGDKLQKYMYARLNGKSIILFKVPKNYKWENIKPDEVLLVNKRKYTSDDGVDYAKLAVHTKFTTKHLKDHYTVKDIIDDRRGAKGKVDVVVLYSTDTHLVVYTEDELKSLDINTIPNEMLTKIKQHGNLFSLQLEENGNIATYEKQTKRKRLTQT